MQERTGAIPLIIEASTNVSSTRMLAKSTGLPGLDIANTLATADGIAAITAQIQRGATSDLMLASALASFGSDSLPPFYRDHFSPQLDPSDLTVSLESQNWFMCFPNTETYMNIALNNDGIIIVNGFLAVKFVGKLAGLCIQTTSTVKGTFLEGSWYCPKTPELRQQLQQDYVDKKTAVGYQDGNWLLMRGKIDDTGDFVLNRAKTYQPPANPVRLPLTL